MIVIKGILDIKASYLFCLMPTAQADGVKASARGLRVMSRSDCSGQKKPWANPRQTTERGEAFRLLVFC